MMDHPRLGVRQILSLPCDHSTLIISEGMDRELLRRERWALRLHLLTCRSCRRFRAQLDLLRRVVMLQFGDRAPDDADRRTPVELSSKAKARISGALDTAMRRRPDSS